MKILIELPTWIGDTVMVTPSIENIVKLYPNVKISLIGENKCLDIFKKHPNVIKFHEIKKSYWDIFLKAKSLDFYDLFLSFRKTYRSNFLNYLVKAEKKFQYKKQKFVTGHQVEKYSLFVHSTLGTVKSAGLLQIYNNKVKFIQQKKVGINVGAAYGNAKKWNLNKFSEVAIQLSEDYEIILFGSINEQTATQEIENNLRKSGIENYRNLAGTTSVAELIDEISELSLFITGDSGPMHIAAAFQIPTISLFGPTKHEETCQWKNSKSLILKKDLECQPCMKRTCPLIHHNCMEMISVREVLKAIEKFNL